MTLKSKKPMAKSNERVMHATEPPPTPSAGLQDDVVAGHPSEQASNRHRGRKTVQPEKRNSTSFGKGKSGNPGGRPKEASDVKALARQHTPAAIAKLVELMGGETPGPAVAAAKELLDRAWGKSPQSLTDADGAALIVQLVKFGDK